MPPAAEEQQERSLPTRLNPLLKSPPTHQELVDSRRLGQTILSEKAGSSGPFSYVHLRVQLPSPLEEQELFGAGAPESYFLMRRSKDGFVSCTGMFKASFPWARKVEEETEKQYVKQHFKTTSKEETAGNLWVAPIDALALASDYGIRPWIEALLDNQPVAPSDHRKRNITPPPPFFMGGSESDAGSVSSVPPSAGTRRRSTRSASPSKRIITPRKSRASKARDSPLKKTVSPIVENEVSTLKTTETTTLTSTALTNGRISAQTTPIKKNNPVKVQVDETVETNGDVEVKTTHLKVELPSGGEPPSAESTEEMLAKAREMVAEARKLEGESGLNSKSGKRKIEDVEDADEDKSDEADQERDLKKAKRSKVLEDQLRKERVKNRALLGLSATLAIGALLPYVL